MLITKISLIDKSGIVVASIPRVTDKEEKELLASGLISAILTFSEEIQQQEIKSINYHDYTTSFIKYHELILLIEIPNAIDKELQNQLLAIIKDQAGNYLEKQGSKSISQEEGESILEGIFNSINWDELGLKKPFTDAERGKLYLHHKEQAVEILSEGKVELYLQSLADIIDQRLRECHFELPDDEIGVFIPFMEREFSTYSFIRMLDEDKTEAGILRVTEDKSDTLFRMTPLLTKQIRNLLKNNREFSINDALEIIMNKTIDTRTYKKVLNEDQFSLLFLEKNVKNIDRALWSVITGDSVIVIGDKVSTRICTNTLSIFGQHLYTEVIEWLSKDETQIGGNITGMSQEHYNSLVKKGVIAQGTTIVNLLEGKTIGEKGSDYFKLLMDKMKRKELQEAYHSIGKELEQLIKNAIKIINFTQLEKEQAIKQLKELKKEINHKEKFDSIMTLAIKRNPLIKPYMDELQSTISAAEDYLSIF